MNDAYDDLLLEQKLERERFERLMKAKDGILKDRQVEGPLNCPFEPKLRKEYGYTWYKIENLDEMKTFCEAVNRDFDYIYRNRKPSFPEYIGYNALSGEMRLASSQIMRYRNFTKQYNAFLNFFPNLEETVPEND